MKYEVRNTYTLLHRSILILSPSYTHVHHVHLELSSSSYSIKFPSKNCVYISNFHHISECVLPITSSSAQRYFFKQLFQILFVFSVLGSDMFVSTETDWLCEDYHLLKYNEFSQEYSVSINCKTEAVCSPETSEDLYRSTHSYISVVLIVTTTRTSNPKYVSISSHDSLFLPPHHESSSSSI
jgi:hypothetical protein